MTAKDQEPYISAAIESILDQSYTDFELIVIDDGSTDRTGQIIQEIAARDPRVVVSSCPTRGRVPCLNHALSVVRGRYIAIMDADDLSHPERLRLQVEHLEANPDVQVLGSRHADLRQNEFAIPPLVGRAVAMKPVMPRSRLRGFNIRPLPLMHATALMRREALDRIGGYRRAFRHQEDTDLFMRLEEVGEIRNLPEVLYFYRRHENNTGRRHPVAQTASWVLSVILAKRRRRGRDDWADAASTGEIWRKLALHEPVLALHAGLLVLFQYMRKKRKHVAQHRWQKLAVGTVGSQMAQSDT